MKLFFCALGVLIPLFTLAAVQQATIITRPGVVTAPIKYYFDLSSALSEGVNQGVKVTVSASNSEKTAVRFDSVKLFDQSGATVGNNVASKTDALTANPYGFTFDNFGVAPADLAKVAGVQITFMDLGGENPTGKVTIQSVAVSVIRDTGEACVIIDPIIITTPPPPIPTIVSIQTARPLVQPGTHGTGGSGGSCGAQQDTFSTAGSTTWTAPTGVTSVRVQVWGAGGSGSSASGDLGAGGGAYSERVSVTVVPGTVYSIVVGAGGAAGGVTGGDSYFSTSVVLAKGGDKGGVGFGLGGNMAGGVGEIKYSGGNGGTGMGGGGGGGGSSAGSSGSGSDGVMTAGGAAPTGGGNGGNGGSNIDGNGSAGSAPGGGGGSGGSGAGTTGGLGGDGKVVLSYTSSGCGASAYDSFMNLLRTLFRFKK